MVQIQENFLNELDYKELFNCVNSSEDFPWFCNMNIQYDKNESNIDNEFNKVNGFNHYTQFVHIIFHNGIPNSTYYEVFNTILLSKFLLENSVLKRVKVNLLVPINGFEKNCIGLPHVDTTDSFFNKTSIYYLNDSDGDTVFFDNNLKIIKKVTPKANNLITFPTNLIHASSLPFNTKKRMVINIVYRQ